MASGKSGEGVKTYHRPATKEYRDNWQAIFSKGKETCDCGKPARWVKTLDRSTLRYESILVCEKWPHCH